VAEQERAVGNRNMQGHSGQHGLDVRGHIVRPFRGMEPALARRHQAIERGREVSLHVGIGIFLNDQRRRGMPQIEQPSLAPAAAMKRAASGVISVKPGPLVLITRVALVTNAAGALVNSDSSCGATGSSRWRAVTTA
jgi:hypothetical protein